VLQRSGRFRRIVYLQNKGSARNVQITVQKKVVGIHVPEPLLVEIARQEDASILVIRALFLQNGQG